MHPLKNASSFPSNPPIFQFLIFIVLLQLCVWSTDGWERQASKFLPIPSGRAPAPLADTRVQFHLDQIHLLVVHETQIALYDAQKLECLKQVSLIYKYMYTDTYT